MNHRGYTPKTISATNGTLMINSPGVYWSDIFMVSSDEDNYPIDVTEEMFLTEIEEESVEASFTLYDWHQTWLAFVNRYDWPFKSIELNGGFPS